LNWILSRTEYDSSGAVYGVLGAVEWNQDLDQYEPARNEFKEPDEWQALGFHHFGAIVHDDQSGITFISLGGTIYKASQLKCRQNEPI
jgi:hypothetical protein